MLGLIDSAGKKPGSIGASPASSSPRTTSPSRRVLIVEDNIDASLIE